MSKFIAKIRSSEEGVTAIEYGLIAAGIAVVIILSVSLLGGNIKNTFNNIANAI